MKHWTRKWIPSTLTVMLLLAIPVNTLSVTAYADTVTQTEATAPVTLQETSSVVVQPKVEQPEVVPPQATSPVTQPDPPQVTVPVIQPEPSGTVVKPEATEAPKPDVKLTYEQQRKAVMDALDAFKKEATKENMLAVLDKFFMLPALKTYPISIQQNDKKNFSDDIIKVMPLVVSSSAADTQLELKQYFATNAVSVLEKSMHPYDYDVAEKAIKLLPESPQRTELATKIDQLSKTIFSNDNSDYIDWSNQPDDLKVHPVPSADPNVPQPGSSGGSTTPPVVTPPVIYEKTDLTYRIENGTCFKVLDHYKNGSIAKTEKIKPDKQEQIFCGASGTPDAHTDDHADGDHGSHNPFPYAGVNTTPEPTGSVFKGYDPFNASMREQLIKEEDKKKALEPITIQFTFEKASESPYYHDTGITIGEAKLLTYVQAKDALHQIAVQARGKYVEDADQSLALIDGKMILVVNSGKEMSFSEFTALFSNTSVGVRALDTRSAKQTDLADLIEIKGVQTITVGDKEIKLDAKPIVDNSVALFPLEQIAKELGGNVTVNGKAITVQGKNHTLVYEDGKSTIRLDDKDVSLTVPVRANKDGIILSPIRALVHAFGKSLELDKDSSKLVVK